MSHIKGQGRLQKVFTNTMSLRNLREWNQVNKFGQYNCICVTRWVITLSDKPLKIKTDARMLRREKSKSKSSGFKAIGSVGGGPWDWVSRGQERPIHTWRCWERSKGKYKVWEEVTSELADKARLNNALFLMESAWQWPCESVWV